MSGAYPDSGTFVKHDVPFSDVYRIQRGWDGLTVADKTFWGNVSKVLKERGEKPTALNKVPGLGRTTVHRWRTQPDVKPDTDKVRLVAKFLGVSVDQLLGTIELPDVERPPLVTIDSAEAKIVEAIRRDDHLEAAVRSLIKHWRFPNDARE